MRRAGPVARFELRDGVAARPAPSRQQHAVSEDRTHGGVPTPEEPPDRGNSRNPLTEWPANVRSLTRVM
jgi:hypothetical protein